MTNNPPLEEALQDLISAPFVVDVEKQMGSEFWSNRYFLNAPDLADAVAAARTIALAERKITSAAAVFTKMSVRSTTPGSEVYTTVPMNFRGDRSGLGAEHYPLFAVVRVDFAVERGRPSRKYLRGVIFENEANGFQLANGIIDVVTAEYVTPLVALQQYVDIDNSAITEGTVKPDVAMRQLRRGSKKKSTP